MKRVVEWGEDSRRGGRGSLLGRNLPRRADRGLLPQIRRHPCRRRERAESNWRGISVSEFRWWWLRRRRPRKEKQKKKELRTRGDVRRTRP